MVKVRPKIKPKVQESINLISLSTRTRNQALWFYDRWLLLVIVPRAAGGPVSITFRYYCTYSYKLHTTEIWEWIINSSSMLAWWRSVLHASILWWNRMTLRQHQLREVWIFSIIICYPMSYSSTWSLSYESKLLLLRNGRHWIQFHLSLVYISQPQPLNLFSLISSATSLLLCFVRYNPFASWTRAAVIIIVIIVTYQPLVVDVFASLAFYALFSC